MRTGRMVAWPAAVALALAGCGSMDSGASAAAQCSAANATAVSGAIQIAGMAFVPACARVAPGTAITFTNDDADQHTVTSDAGQADTFDSGPLNQGAQFVHTFASAGTEHIHCTIHPTMHLSVVVQ